MKAENNYVIVGFEKVETTTKKTKSGLYLLNQEKTDTTKDGDKIVTTKVKIIAKGPKADIAANIGDCVVINYYNCQTFTLGDKVYGVLEDTDIKVVYDKEELEEQDE